MRWLNKVDDVYLIDTWMLGFKHYNSCYLVKGKKLALIDTGQPAYYEKLRSGIKAHGFSVKDISYIFVTHPHLDHDGNVGSLLKENSEAIVCVHPEGVEHMINPDIAIGRSLSKMPPKMAETFLKRAGMPVPVSKERIRLLKDGEVFDLGNGKKLEVMFAPQHQPGGIVLFEESTGGVFINDLVGNYFEDVDLQISLTPAGSDVKQTIKTLEKIMSRSPTMLFLGHFGICNKPREIIQRAIDDMKLLLDIGTNCIKEGKPEEIASRVLAHITTKLEARKSEIINIRGEDQYNYLKDELAQNLANNFAKYMQTQI